MADIRAILFSGVGALLLLAALLVGVSLGIALLKLPQLSVGSELALGSIVQSSVTLISAFLVTLVLQKRVADLSKKKELFVKQCDQVLEMLLELEEVEFPRELTKIVRVLKRVSVRCSTLRHCATECNLPDRVCKLLDFGAQVTVLRRLATETPVVKMINHASDKRYAAVVKDGMLTLTEERQADLNEAIEKMRQELIVAQLHITAL